MIDIVDDLKLGAGLQHVMDCLLEYKKRHAQSSDCEHLLHYAEQMNNGALFKKLGFLAEQLDFRQSFIDSCAKHLTRGYAYLDKRVKQNKLVTRWRLWVPRNFTV